MQRRLHMLSGLSYNFLQTARNVLISLKAYLIIMRLGFNLKDLKLSLLALF